jgi:hypothetical protein
LAGGDINLVGHDTNAGKIVWKGTYYDIEMWTNSAGTFFYLVPVADAMACFQLGLSARRFDSMSFFSKSSIELLTNNVVSYIRLGMKYYNKYYDFTEDIIRSNTNKEADIGASIYAFDDVYADDFINVADYYYLDKIIIDGNLVEVDDIEIIEQIKPSEYYDDCTGFSLIDDKTLPNWLLRKYKKDITLYDDEGNIAEKFKKGEIMKDPDNKPYLSQKSMISLCMGAIRQLNAKIKELEK